MHANLVDQNTRELSKYIMTWLPPFSSKMTSLQEAWKRNELGMTSTEELKIETVGPSQTLFIY